MEMTSAILIRPANQADLAAMLPILNHEILNSTAVYDYTPKSEKDFNTWFLSKKDRNYPVFVACQKDKVVGYASYDRYRPFDGFCRSVEHSIYVHPDFRKMKIGHLLMEKLISQAKIDGLKAMIGGIDKDNQNSIDFHQKYGFKIVGELPDVGFKFDRFLTLIFMQKTF